MDTLRLYLITWNVACKPPEENLDDLLGLSNASQPLPDLYVIGLQEVKAQVQNIVLDALFDDPWTNSFKSKLREKDYVKIKTVRLQGIMLILFSLRKHILSIRDVEMQHVKTGLGGFWGNKGGVSLRLAIGGVSVCLVNSHMTPHDHNLQARVNDYNAIVKEMTFSIQKETSLVFYHDYVFWIGDHNFRLDETISHEDVLDRISKGEIDWLHDQDQLKTVMKTGQAFSELTEPPSNFPPTFKFYFNSSEYDPKRRPAWTDRILYKVTENAYENLTLSAKPLSYTSKPNYTQSDHKPVVSQFLFKTFSHHVDRAVDFVGITSWVMNKENIVTVTPHEDVTVNDFDWIGLYKADFAALDDYLAFMYINPRTPITDADDVLHQRRTTPPTGKATVRFPDHTIRTPGSYCLLYITHDSSSVLGMSAIFRAESSTRGLTNSNTSVLGPYLRAKDGWESLSTKSSPQLSPKQKTPPSDLI